MVALALGEGERPTEGVQGYGVECGSTSVAGRFIASGVRA